MRRKFARDIAAHLANLSVQRIAYVFKLEHATALHAIFALETEGQAQVNQLQQRQVFDRVL
ncbi:hypothetical protein D3C84_547390 [compost metagenome]